jgi:Secretion system C-terminal sorting domain
MKSLYPTQVMHAFRNAVTKLAITAVVLTAAATSNAQNKELVFDHHTLVSGTDGADGATYRFTNVTTNIDALVTINKRSAALVQMVHLDTTSIGHDKALQPQITYNGNTTPAGVSDWWMEFQISFVNSNSSTAVPVTNFDLTALDIDGNGDKINESVSIFGLKNYKLEKTTALAVSDIWELVNNASKKTGLVFTGPVTNYTNIDTSATSVMVTNNFVNTNSFRVRFGGHSTGVSGAADRLYSLYFKSFSYSTPVQITLPLTLVDWTAVLNDNNVKLSWATTTQLNTSHFVIERSADGKEFKDIAMIFAEGNSSVRVPYAYTDKLPSFSAGVLYYRLRCVDLDGRSTYSAVKVVKVGKQTESMKLTVFPNPAINNMQVAIPAEWQNKKVVFDLYASNGNLIKRITTDQSSQVLTVQLSDVPAGVYVMKASCDNSVAFQQIIHSK